MALFTLSLCLPFYHLKWHCSFSYYSIFIYKYIFPHEKIIRNAFKRGKPVRKPYHPYCFRNLTNKSINEEDSSFFMNSIVQHGINEAKVETSSLRNLKKPQRNYTFMNPISVNCHLRMRSSRVVRASVCLPMLKCSRNSPEPEFLNLKGAQEAIPRNQFHQAV